MTARSDGDGARLELTWSEHGGPVIDGFQQRGFGTELIERGIRFELQGEAKLDAVDGGLQRVLRRRRQFGADHRGVGIEPRHGHRGHLLGAAVGIFVERGGDRRRIDSA